MCHHVQISSKVTNLNSSLYAPKTCEVWISLNPSVSSSAYLKISHSFFPFSIFLRIERVFQMVFVLWFLIAEWFLLIISSSFIVPSYGFWYTVDSLHLLLWILELMLCQQYWWLVLSSFSHYIFLLRFSSKKSPINLSLLGVSRGWLLISFFKASKEAF